MGYVNATEVRPSDFDFGEGNTVDGVRTHVSRASEKDEDAHHEDDGCLDHWLSRRCRGLDWFDTGTHTGWRWRLSITFRATDTTVWTWSGPGVVD